MSSITIFKTTAECPVNCATPTCKQHVDSPAGQGSDGTGTHTAVAALYVLGRLAVCGGGRQQEGSVGQILKAISRRLWQDLAILEPRDIERSVAGTQVAVQQKWQT